MKPALCLLLAAGLASSQRAYDPANLTRELGMPDPKGLAQRIFASEYVVTGTVVAAQPVQTKHNAEQLAEMSKPENRDKPFNLNLNASAISLATIRVDATLCRRSDFQENSTPLPSPSEILILRSFEFKTDQAFRYEVLSPGSRYLFTVGRDPEIQTKLAGHVLDEARAYFQVLEHSWGAIELPSGKGPFKPAGYKSDKDLATPVLKIATELCKALQPPTTNQKVAALKKLKSSRDPMMRENAAVAIGLVQANQRY